MCSPPTALTRQFRPIPTLVAPPAVPRPPVHTDATDGTVPCVVVVLPVVAGAAEGEEGAAVQGGGGECHAHQLLL